MAEVPRLIQRQGSGKINGLSENMNTKKISVSEHLINGVNAKSDGFIVDLESLSNGGGLYNHISSYSRITLPRSLSRKGHHRGAGDSTSLLVAATCSPPPSSSSPKGQSGANSSMQEQEAATPLPPVVITVGPTHDEPDPNHQPNNHHHHQITMKTGSIIPAVSPAPENLLGRRRSPLPWYSHPKRVLLFFATISSIGTLLLICFTLAINKPYSSSD